MIHHLVSSNISLAKSALRLLLPTFGGVDLLYTHILWQWLYNNALTPIISLIQFIDLEDTKVVLNLMFVNFIFI